MTKNMKIFLIAAIAIISIGFGGGPDSRITLTNPVFDSLIGAMIVVVTYNVIYEVLIKGRPFVQRPNMKEGEKPITTKWSIIQNKWIMGVSGKIFLTSDALYFQSDIMGFQDIYESISLFDISDVQLYRPKFSVFNGARIHLKNGDEIKFVMFGRKKFLREMEAVLA